MKQSYPEPPLQHRESRALTITSVNSKHLDFNLAHDVLGSPTVARTEIDKHMLKILKQMESAKFVRFNLHGGFTGEYVPEVEKALSVNGYKDGKVALDLMNVTFVDREAMEFLGRAISRNKFVIENIPSYVKRWIEQEVS